MLRSRVVEYTVLMKNLGDVDTAVGNFSPGGLDVGDDQVQTVRGASGCGRQTRPDDDRGRGSRWGELNDPVTLIDDEVGVETEIKVLIKILRPFHIGDGKDDDFKLEFHDDLLSFCVAGFGAVR